MPASVSFAGPGGPRPRRSGIAFQLRSNVVAYHKTGRLSRVLRRALRGALACGPARWMGIDPRQTPHLCKDSALSPLGERVARDGAITGRRGTGEGVPTWIDYLTIRASKQRGPPVLRSASLPFQRSSRAIE